MRVLVDTHTLLWYLGFSDSSKLGSAAKQCLLEAETVYVSSISLLEIHIKTMLGKLDAPEHMEIKIKQAGAETLSFSSAAADAIRLFPNLLRHDPFDRMLVAQAISDNLVFMTTDNVLLGLKNIRLIDAKK